MVAMLDPIKVRRVNRCAKTVRWAHIMLYNRNPLVCRAVPAALVMHRLSPLVWLVMWALCNHCRVNRYAPIASPALLWAALDNKYAHYVPPVQ